MRLTLDEPAASAVDEPASAAAIPAADADGVIIVAGKRYLTLQRLAKILGKSTRTLARWNEQRIGPPRIKVGNLPLFDEENCRHGSRGTNNSPCACSAAVDQGAVMLDRPPDPHQKSPPRRHNAEGPNQKIFYLICTHPVRPGQYSWKKISIDAVAATVRDNGVPIRARITALQACYDLRRGAELGRDRGRASRRMCAQRRHQLKAAARLYGLGRRW